MADRYHRLAGRLAWAAVAVAVLMAALSIYLAQARSGLLQRVQELGRENASLRANLDSTQLQLRDARNEASLAEGAEAAAVREVEDAEGGEDDARLEALEAKSKADMAEEQPCQHSQPAY